MEDQSTFVVDLYKDGCFYAQRSMDCGPSTFKTAKSQWERNGFVVKILRQPKTNKK